MDIQAKEITPKVIPQWLARSLVYLSILFIGYMGFAFISSGMIMPGDLMREVNHNSMKVIELERQVTVLQEKILVMLSEHERRLNRLENHEDYANPGNRTKTKGY